jgi:serine kinase of HPr protein (carbohydrate metabolism regulator)
VSAAAESSTVHASAVLVGSHAALIRGPAGSGKSRLALDLLHASQAGLLTFARLVADDRVYLAACHGRLLARAPEPIAGLLEVWGLGMRQVPYEQTAVVGLVVDLAGAGAARMPARAERETTIAGIKLPRLAVAAGADALLQVLAYLHTAAPPAERTLPRRDADLVAKK